jgi:hypothetical protein
MASNPTERLESLKRRHRQIEELGIRSETEVKSHTETQTQLLKQMQEEFGVDSVDKLRKLAKEMHDEDVSKLDALEKAISETESQLEALNNPAA